MILDLVVISIVMASMIAILVVSYGKQQEKYNRRRQYDNSRNN